MQDIKQLIENAGFAKFHGLAKSIQSATEDINLGIADRLAGSSGLGMNAAQRIRFALGCMTGDRVRSTPKQFKRKKTSYGDNLRAHFDSKRGKSKRHGRA